MADTLFTYFRGAVSNGDDTNPDESSSFVVPPMTSHQNVLYYRRETVPLDDGDTRTVSLPDYASSQWVGFMARVIGDAKLTTVGTNWDGSTAITGVTVGYGVEAHPGYMSMSSINVTTMTLEALADSTTVEYLVMILATDDAL